MEDTKVLRKDGRKFKTVSVADTMTKEDEIYAFNRFYSILPEDSYLKLILKGVAEHIEQQIRDDHAIALVESIQYYSLQSEGNLALARNNAEELTRLRAEITIVENNFNAVQDDNETLRADNKYYKGLSEKVALEVSDIAGKMQQAETELNGLKNDLVKARGELIGYKQTVAKDEVFIGQLLGELHNLRLEKGVLEQERDEYKAMYENEILRVKGALT
jgi:chromosome segregation ATPase